MVERDEELAEALARGMQGCVDRSNCVSGDAVRGENVMNNSCCLRGGIGDEFCRFADCGLV